MEKQNKMEKQKEVKATKIVRKIKLGRRTKYYRRKVKKRVFHRSYIVHYKVWNDGDQLEETKEFRTVGEARLLAQQCYRNDNLVKLVNNNGVTLTI